MIDIVNEKGFIFSSFHPDPEMLQELLSSDEPSSKVESFVIGILRDHGFSFEKLHLVYEDVRIGQLHELHTHLTPSDFQAVLWVPQEEYEGRAFLYGSPDNVKKFYPKYGDICFMKTNDLNYIHGVEPLLNDTLVRTLVISVNYRGLLGEHVTVSADGYKIY